MEWPLLYRKLPMLPSGFEIWEVPAFGEHLQEWKSSLLLPGPDFWSSLAGESGQVVFTPCSCQCVTWQGWATWIQIPPLLVKAGSQEESCSFPSSTQWRAIPQGDLHSLLWKAVNYTPITGWKWLGKYFERRRNFVETTALSHFWMEKGELKGSPWQMICWTLFILTVLLPLFFPLFLIFLLFYTCYSKSDETIVSKLIFFFPFQISHVNKYFKGRENSHANFYPRAYFYSSVINPLKKKNVYNGPDRGI